MADGGREIGLKVAGKRPDCLSVNTDSFHLCVFSGVRTTEGPEGNSCFSFLC